MPADIPVATPAYTRGPPFYSSETDGILPASLSAVSRYYKATTAGGCAPTITALPASDYSFDEAAKDPHEMPSVDHACESRLWAENAYLTAHADRS